MTDRIYRLLLGIAILVALYFDMTRVMYGLIGAMLLEGATNWRIPLLLNRLLRLPGANIQPMGPFSNPWPLHSEQIWRLVVGFMLLLTAVLFKESVWFLPWFMGFAILGAGMSGVCPMMYGLYAVGCRH
jgi:hypothetical protein